MMEAASLRFREFPLNKGGSAVGAGVVLMSEGNSDGQPPGAVRLLSLRDRSRFAPPPLLRGNVVRF